MCAGEKERSKWEKQLAIERRASERVYNIVTEYWGGRTVFLVHTQPVELAFLSRSYVSSGFFKL